jgi:hypothetical protein
VGASLLVRPDGLLLLPFVLLRACWAPGRRGPSWRVPGQRAANALRVAAGFAVICLPYLAFNQWLGGSVWPNTFYAKQAEYAALRARPLWTRLAEMATMPLVGGQALLVPGLVTLAWRSVRRRQWEAVLPLAWVAAMLGAYGWARTLCGCQ